jgi:hypothetical protein
MKRQNFFAITMMAAAVGFAASSCSNKNNPSTPNYATTYSVTVVATMASKTSTGADTTLTMTPPNTTADLTITAVGDSAFTASTTFSVNQGTDIPINIAGLRLDSLIKVGTNIAFKIPKQNEAASVTMMPNTSPTKGSVEGVVLPNEQNIIKAHGGFSFPDNKEKIEFMGKVNITIGINMNIDIYVVGSKK